MEAFNLIDEKWIPVRLNDGTLEEIGLKQLYLNGSEYSRLEISNPLEYISVLRLLLAVLYRALDGPQTPADNVEWLKEGFPKDKIEEYFEIWYDRFYLFHDKYPFFQIKGLAEEIGQDKLEPWYQMNPELGSNNTYLSFNPKKRLHSETNFPAKPAEALRILILHQCFSVGGLLHRLFSSAKEAPLVDAAFISLVGKNLHETLCLNLTRINNQKALWEKDPPSLQDIKNDIKNKPEKKPMTEIDLFLWRSLAIELIPTNVNGVLQVENIARGVVFYNINHMLFDPMSAYYALKEKWIPYKLKNTEKGFWRDYSTLLPHQKDNNKHKNPSIINWSLQIINLIEQTRRPSQGINLMICRQIREQGKIQTWRMEHLKLPSQIWDKYENRNDIQEILLIVEEIGEYLENALRVYAKYQLNPDENKKPSNKNLNKIIASYPSKRLFWTLMETGFHEALDKMNEPYDFENLWQWWWKLCKHNAIKAFHALTDSLDNTARSLKAMVKAETNLKFNLSKYFERIGGENGTK